ncbi:MAG: immune inhibitor A [Anaerolineae bacterium]|nr:immune inhibitor A [Anaerolineae bacterium]
MNREGNTASRPHRTLIIAIIVALVTLCCCFTTFLATSGVVLWTTRHTSSTAAPSPWAHPTEPAPYPIGTPTPQATPIPTRPPTETERQLERVLVPTRDLRDLAERLEPGIGEIPPTVNPTPPSYQVGDRAKFWVSNTDTDEHFQIEAELQYITPHVYMWVEVGAKVNQDDLEQAADRFENKIYPTDREFFGSEWTPGVDNDPHLTILHAHGLGDHIAGYYSSADEVSHLAQRYSNEREMFYINLDNVRPGTDFYDSVLAHEFQHMIHWYNDRNEETWVNEGFSELAAMLNGFTSGRADRLYTDEPDTQLTTWSDDPGGNGAHYGASFLFMDYFLERFGESLTKAVIASPANGIIGFNDALAAASRPERFDDIFADWLIANYLDDPSIGDGRYGYRLYHPHSVAMDERYRSYPVQRESTVQQYAADYVLLQGKGDVVIHFQGATTTRLADTQAHSGRFAWWANRADDSDSRLTREFDLTGVTQATLKMWLWYDLEDKYDYAYVEVSIDGGKAWTILPGKYTTDENPTGNSFGPGYTGKSGGGDVPRWVLEDIDLTPYTGQKVLIRLEYITDDAVNYPGIFVDDISIPEIGYDEDFETGDGGWIPEGWIRTDNRINQRWLVQVIEKSRHDVSVRRMAVGPDGTGMITVDGLGRDGKSAVLVISALAPATTEVAPYAYTIEPR